MVQVEQRDTGGDTEAASQDSAPGDEPMHAARQAPAALATAPLDAIDAHFGYPDGVGCVRAARRLPIGNSCDRSERIDTPRHSLP